MEPRHRLGFPFHMTTLSLSQPSVEACAGESGGRGGSAGLS